MPVKGKCNYCGAPLKGSSLRCDYCNQSSIGNFSIDLKKINTKKRDVIEKIKIKLSYIPIPYQEKLNEQRKLLLKKQNILSDDQITFLRKTINRLLKKKRNIVILISIPIGFISYLKLNYPKIAKPYYPDFPYKMPTVEETGKFIFYGTNQTKEFLIFNKFWCKNYRKRTTLSKCLKDNYVLEKSYFDIGSEKKEEDWFIYKLAKSTRDKKPSTKDMLDVAINCKEGLISFYTNRGLSYFNEMKSRFPRSFGYEEEQEYKREKPMGVMRKMGKLWWISNDVETDLESGRYIAFAKSNIDGYESDISKELSKKSPTKRDLEYRNTLRSLLKSSKTSLLYEKYSRNANRKSRTNLFKKVCNRGPLGLF